MVGIIYEVVYEGKQTFGRGMESEVEAVEREADAEGIQFLEFLI